MHTRASLHLAVLLLALACGAGRAPGADYRVARCEPGAITPDGALREAAWETAQVMAGFSTAGPAPLPARAATEARLLHDGENLYVAFSADVLYFRTFGAARDDTVWMGECVEVFLCPGPEAVPYYEIDINPDGVLYDARVRDWRYEVLHTNWLEWAREFNPPVRAATSLVRGPDGRVSSWRAEWTVPFSALGGRRPPAPGDTWRFNVARAAALDDKAMEYSSWRPTFADFHRPLTFPRLVFSGSVTQAPTNASGIPLEREPGHP